MLHITYERLSKYLWKIFPLLGSRMFVYQLYFTSPNSFEISQKKTHTHPNLTSRFGWQKSKNGKNTKIFLVPHSVSGSMICCCVIRYCKFLFLSFIQIFQYTPLIPTKMNHFYTRKDYFIGIFFILRYKFCVFFTQTFLFVFLQSQE